MRKPASGFGFRAALPALLTTLVLAGCGGSGDDGSANDGRPVTLALDFQPNAVHAGIFAAVDDGLDEREGVDADRAHPGRLDRLAQAAATPARPSSPWWTSTTWGWPASAGRTWSGVGAIVQRPLAAVIARAGVRRPRELEGRRVGVTGLPSDEAVLRSVVRADGGDPDGCARTTIGFAAVPSLAAGKVDAVVTFWNAEGVALKRRGVRTREFRVDSYGAPRYPELVLATRRANAAVGPGPGARRRVRPACRHARRGRRPVRARPPRWPAAHRETAG